MTKYTERKHFSGNYIEQVAQTQFAGLDPKTKHSFFKGLGAYKFTRELDLPRYFKRSACGDVK